MGEQISEETRDFTAFTTLAWRYRFKWLVFGVTSAPEIYQHAIQQALYGCKGVRSISDDMILHDKDDQQHLVCCYFDAIVYGRNELWLWLKHFCWSRVEFSLYCVLLFGLNPDISLTVKHYMSVCQSGRRSVSHTVTSKLVFMQVSSILPLKWHFQMSSSSPSATHYLVRSLIPLD